MGAGSSLWPSRGPTDMADWLRMLPEPAANGLATQKHQHTEVPRTHLEEELVDHLHQPYHAAYLITGPLVCDHKACGIVILHCDG